QARRAEKHSEVSSRLLVVRAALLASRRASLTVLLETRQGTLAAATLVDVEAAAALAASDADLEALRRQLDDAHARLAAAREEEAGANAAAQRREAEEVAARREHADAVARREAAVAEARRLSETLHSLAEREASLVGAVD